MSRPGLKAWLLAIAVTSTNALVFWTPWKPSGSPNLFSFWNRSWVECVFLTVLYVVFSARILLWYHDRISRYGTVRKRSVPRLLPLAFGVAVCGATLTWWLTVVVAVPTIELHGVLFKGAPLEWTILLLPFSYFVQLLFLTPSTVIWFLAAGITWPVASLWPLTGNILSTYYQVPQEARPSTPPGFLKVWNVFGYLVFLLSLLFQSGN